MYEKQDLKGRTKAFALSVIRLLQSIGTRPEHRVISQQLLRSGTSVAANYRAACRARSRAEFISKMGIVVEEADESCFWLELLRDANLASAEIHAVLREANELTAIFTASRKTAESHRTAAKASD